MDNASVIGSWAWNWAFKFFSVPFSWMNSLINASGMRTYYIIYFFFAQIFVFFLLRLRPAAISGVDGLLNGRARARKEARQARLERSSKGK